MGQLYARGIRLPATGALRPLAESVNQIVIFAPMLALLALRHHSLETAWIRRDRAALRIGIGFVLATIAIIAFTTVYRDAPSPGTVISRTYRPASAHIGVQVLLEDIAIAILIVRFAAALGPRRAILLVAALFAAGHIPSLLATGGTQAELISLIRDAALAAGVFAVALRGADVWVLWPVHFAMDMMQFAIPGRQP